MDIELRSFGSGAPGDGTLWIRAGDRRDLAALVLSGGLAALERGPGTTTRVVVSADPTLDDLLALSAACALLAGETLPTGLEAFARYAALVREGLHPGKVPLEASLEGVFLAIRNDVSGKLDVPVNAQAFLAGWERLRARIWNCAAAGLDPFEAPVVTAALGFSRELAYLAKDREVFRQDVRQGERWVVRLPGGPPEAAALLLREPKSLLFKSWSRSDPDALLGAGTNLLLGVSRPGGQWIFSTDPVQRLSLLELATALQTAEREVDAARATADPWFDGARFRHTLIAAPHGGSLLPDAQVLALVRRWASARSPRAPRARPVLAGLTAAALLALGIGTGRLATTAPWWQDERPIARGSRVPREKLDRVRTEGLARPSFALLVAVGERQGQLSHLEAARPDAGRLYALLRDRFGYRPEHVWLLSDGPVPIEGPLPSHNGPATRDGLLAALEELQQATNAYEESTFLFYYAGHGVPEEAAERIGHLVLSGFDAAHPWKSGYEMSHLSDDLAARLRPRHQLVLLDCCFSGLATTRGTDTDVGHVYELWKKRAHVLITAASEVQTASEQSGRAAFTTALLLGLGEGLPADVAVDGARDGIVTHDELFAFVRAHVEGQTPQRALRRREVDDVGQFLFVPR